MHIKYILKISFLPQLKPETNRGIRQEVSLKKNPALMYCIYTVFTNLHRDMSQHHFAFLFEYQKRCIHLRQQKLAQPSLYLKTHHDI